jgi:hypothetical protein
MTHNLEDMDNIRWLQLTFIAVYLYNRQNRTKHTCHTVLLTCLRTVCKGRPKTII